MVVSEKSPSDHETFSMYITMTFEEKIARQLTR